MSNTGRDLTSGSLIKQIGTHNGRFHADETFAIAMLQVLPTCKDATIIRTRDHEVLKPIDIVVDVGGVYDPETLRFDHHQRSFTHSMSTLCPGKPWVTRLSSAGLIYAHYGKAVISQLVKKPETDDMVTVIYHKMYENFVEEIDAVDNGIEVSEGKLKYRVTTTLSREIQRLNGASDKESAFRKAIQLMRSKFEERVEDYSGKW